MERLAKAPAHSGCVTLDLRRKAEAPTVGAHTLGLPFAVWCGAAPLVPWRVPP